MELPTTGAVLPTITAAAPAAPEHDVRGTLAWRGYTEGVAEARRRGVPILCLAEEPWSNGAQRLALFLVKDTALRELAESAFVPVLANPHERPDVVDRILNVAHAHVRHPGPPHLAVCTAEGLPFLTYCDLRFEGSAEHPTLLGTLLAASRYHEEQPEACRAEARRLAMPASGAQAERGGDEGPGRHLPAFELWRALQAGVPEEAVADRAAALVRSGVYDQLGGGFHRAFRDEAGGVPHFEKPALLNAAMAAVLAACAAGTRGELQDAAEACARFALRCLEADSAGLGSDTGYYTWLASEVLGALPPDELQVVGMHYRIAPAKTRYVLHPVVPASEVAAAATGQEPAAALRALQRGRERLLGVRQQRRPPAPLSPPSRAAKLHTLRWLLEASAWLPELPQEQLLRELREELDEAALSGHGLTSPDGEFRLRDQVAAAQAAGAAGTVTGLPDWSEKQRRLVGATFAHYRTGAGWLERLGSPEACLGAVDHDLPGTLLELSSLPH